MNIVKDGHTVESADNGLDEAMDDMCDGIGQTSVDMAVGHERAVETTWKDGKIIDVRDVTPEDSVMLTPCPGCGDTPPEPQKIDIKSFITGCKNLGASNQCGVVSAETAEIAVSKWNDRVRILPDVSDECLACDSFNNYDLECKHNFAEDCPTFSKPPKTISPCPYCGKMPVRDGRWHGCPGGCLIIEYDESWADAVANSLDNIAQEKINTPERSAAKAWLEAMKDDGYELIVYVDHERQEVSVSGALEFLRLNEDSSLANVVASKGDQYFSIGGDF